MTPVWLGWVIFILVAGCSDDNGKNTTAGSTDSSDSDATDTADKSSDADNPHDGTDSNGNNASGTLGELFRYGINGGHRNNDWSDPVQAALEVQAGCNSQRLSLPERHLDKWGYEIEVSDMAAYAELGFSNQVAFLTSPIRAHSTAPDSAADWELAYYIPANLYEPAVINGQINPSNYWASYVYETVSTYKSRIRVWEIWNEPDYTPNWSDTQTWWDHPPTAEQLPRFNGSIYNYVRMLRVSKEAAQLADPNALIATGGIGYASFLSAILRYSDNPADGSITDAYPQKGGAYIDVLSFHHYPIYTSGNSDAAVAVYLSHFNELKTTLADAGVSVAGYENTETGAPTTVVGDYPGSDAYAVNYLMKVMVSAQAAGIHGIDWFTLSDSNMSGGGDSSYDYMGLFEDVVNLETIDNATIKDTGVAYKTLDMLLGHARYDADETAALSLPSGVTGYAFSTAAGRYALAVWAAVDANEQGSAVVSVNDSHTYDVYSWDHSRSGASDVLSSPGEFTLDGFVKILIARQ